MVNRCCIKGCSKIKRENNKASIHKFPSDEKLKSQWIKNIKELNGQEISMIGKLFVCSLHFENECLQRNYNFSNTTLKTNSVPTLFVNSIVLESDNVDVLYSEDENGEDPLKCFSDNEDVIYSEDEKEEDSLKCLSSGHKIKGTANIETLGMDFENTLKNNSHDEIKSTPKRNRRFRYPNDIKDEDYSSETLKNAITVLRKALQNKNHCIKLLRQKMKRRDNKIDSMHSFLRDLKNKSLLSDNIYEVLHVKLNGMKSK